MNYVFGIDIGGTTMKTAIVSQAGELVFKQSIDTAADRGYVDVVSRLYDVMKAACGHTGIADADIIGVGVGIPGFLDETQRVVLEAVNLGWRDVPLHGAMQQAFDRPVMIENDANVAALGEAWIGAGQGKHHVLCATVGTGVGGGIVVGGQLLRGANGMAGEIGHLVVNRGGYPCNCGHDGCLETLASATALIREARKMQAEGRIPKEIQIIDAKTVFSLAASGNEAAQSVVQTAADWLGYGLALIGNTLNPDCIVIGGGVSKAGDQWLTPVKTAFAKYALGRVAEAAAIVPATLGNDAGVIGASRLLLQPGK